MIYHTVCIVFYWVLGIEMNILVVETNISVADDIRLALCGCFVNCRITVIDSGKQCLGILKDRNCPDILIVGYRLTDMNGLELLREIRDDSDLPVIFLSVNKDLDTLVKAFDNGANDYVEFPFNSRIFIARLKAMIRRSTWDRQPEKNERKPQCLSIN
jgi:DNA-binding response OmpR family regulator